MGESDGAEAGFPRRLRVAALLMPVVGLIGWLLFIGLFRTTWGQDWMVFDTAVKAWARGEPALVLDGAAFTRVLNETHAEALGVPLRFHPWVYPPFTLLLALPFATLSWWASYRVFMAASAAMLAVALWAWRPPGSARTAFVFGAVLVSPATAYTLGSGQNAFFSLALVLGGFAWLGRRPAAAGVLLGLLAFKPQLALLVPVALLAVRAWRTLGVAAATVAALLVASLAVPGLVLWRGWLRLFLGLDPGFATWVNEGRHWGLSLFTNLQLAGVPDRLASAGQAAGVLAAAAAVWLGYRRDLPPARALALLLTAAVFAAPHAGTYDAIWVAAAAALTLAGGGCGAGLAVCAGLAWAAIALTPPALFHLPLLGPATEAALCLALLRAAPARRTGH